MAPKTEARPGGDDDAPRVCGRTAGAYGGLIGLARDVAAHYPELDARFVADGRGAARHRQDRGAALRAGHFVFHRRPATGPHHHWARKVREKIAAIPGFPPELATLVEHLILSHHGSLEFGSPTLPQTREAVALHFLDDMDSKMAAMRTSMDSPRRAWANGGPKSGVATGNFADGEILGARRKPGMRRRAARRAAAKRRASDERRATRTKRGCWGGRAKR